MIVLDECMHDDTGHSLNRVVPREENFASLYDKTTQVLHTEIFCIMRNYYDIFSYTKSSPDRKQKVTHRK